jgi:hypothetical protein
MSHKATSWAVQQRGLKPAVKILLWHLSDRHNVDNGCFPNQAMLANDCEMSRASINRHLDDLERLGLIRRVPRVNPATGKQLSTRYILAFEDDFAALDVDRRVSDCDTVPCLKNADHRVSKTAVPVSQSCEALTSKGTRKEPESSLRDDSARERFARVKAVFPLRPRQNLHRAEKQFLALASADQVDCETGAGRYAGIFESDRQAKGESLDKALGFVPSLANWIAERGWAGLLTAQAGPEVVLLTPGQPEFELVRRHLGDRLIIGKTGNITVKVSDLEEARRIAA